MSTLKTNNIEHLDASTPSIQTTIGGGTILAGVSTVSGTLNVGTGITFNTDGSAKFVGQLDVGNLSTGNGTRLNTTGTIETRVTGAGNAVTIYNGGTASSNIYASIDGNGAATFVGGVQVNDLNPGATDNSNGMRLNASGSIQLGRSGTDTLFAGYNTSSSGGSIAPTSTIRNDGYAAFGGTNSQFFADGEVQLAANKINIQPNGSATFAGNVNCTSDSSNTASLVSAGYVLSNRTSGTASVFNGQLNGGSTSNIKADGSATFASSVVSGSVTAGGGGGNYLSNGEVAAYSSTNSSWLWRGWDASGSSNVLTSSIKADGSATFAGNVVLSTAGSGINFSATGDGSGTATSELLDDYEEGTFTPGVSFGSGATGMTFNEQVGRYTKVGNYVFCSFVYQITNKGSSTGAVNFTGLPYATMNIDTARGGGGITYMTGLSSINQIPILYAVSNRTSIEVYQINQSDGTGTTSSALTDANFNNGSQWRAYFCYYTNS